MTLDGNNTTLESFGGTGVPGVEASHPSTAPAVPGMDGTPPAGAPAAQTMGQAPGQAPAAPGQAPVTDPAQQAAAPTAPWGDRFKSPDEVWKAYQEMESFKGRIGNENRQLSQNLARMEGMLQAMQQRPQAPAQQLPDLNVLAQKVDTGEITLAEFTRAREQVIQAKMEQRFNDRLQEVVGGFKSELEQQKYVDDFLKKPENSGYIEAYTSGQLDAYMQRGLTGEGAWYAYRADMLARQNQELQEKTKTAAQQALEQGRQEGQRLQGAKIPAGSTLGGGPGAGLRAGQQLPAGPMTNTQRLELAKAAVARSRGQAG